jgi:hypothetical protein
MASEILPVFQHINDPQAAEALSEPFIKPRKYMVQTSSEELSLNPLIAGVTYIQEGNRIEAVIAAVPDLTKPYTAIQAFADHYEQSVGHYHRDRDLMFGRIPESARIGNAYHIQRAIEITREDKLRTVAGFAIFGAQEISGGFFMSKRAAIEIPLEGREYGIEHMNKPETGQFALMREIVEGATGEPVSFRGIMQNSPRNQRFGMFVGALFMPELEIAKKRLAEDERAGYYFSLPRTERRKLLTKERKQK